MSPKKKHKPRPGLKPSATIVEAMHAEGYYTPREAADLIGRSASAVHNWIQEQALEEIGGLPGSKKVGPHQWVLLAAAKKRVGMTEAA